VGPHIAVVIRRHEVRRSLQEEGDGDPVSLRSVPALEASAVELESRSFAPPRPHRLHRLAPPGEAVSLGVGHDHAASPVPERPDHVHGPSPTVEPELDEGPRRTPEPHVLHFENSSRLLGRTHEDLVAEPQRRNAAQVPAPVPEIGEDAPVEVHDPLHLGRVQSGGVEVGREDDLPDPVPERLFEMESRLGKGTGAVVDAGEEMGVEVGQKVSHGSVGCEEIGSFTT